MHKKVNATIEFLFVLYNLFSFYHPLQRICLYLGNVILDMCDLRCTV